MFFFKKIKWCHIIIQKFEVFSLTLFPFWLLAGASKSRSFLGKSESGQNGPGSPALLLIFPRELRKISFQLMQSIRVYFQRFLTVILTTGSKRRCDVPYPVFEDVVPHESGSCYAPQQRNHPDQLFQGKEKPPKILGFYKIAIYILFCVIFITYDYFDISRD